MSRLAIRMRGVGRYFGPPLEMDGVARPREAWRSLLQIAGVQTAADDGAAVQATVAAPGDVLQDISLDIERGSVVCLIGASGAGKSVLLRILAGALPPTSGRAELYAPVRALLSTADNLNARLTAVENIHAARPYIDADPPAGAQYAADVIAFAELEGFEHMALRTYSTGMLMRLNVALALCGTPDIVLIDDVLAVGDIAFQQKCVERVQALSAQGTTLLLAISDEDLVRQVATRVVTLAGGRVVRDSAGRDLVSDGRDGTDDDVHWHVSATLPEDSVIRFSRVDLASVRAEQEVCLDLHMAIAAKVDGLLCRPLVSLTTNDGVLLYRSVFPRFVELPRDGMLFAVRLPLRILPPGDYVVALAAASQQDQKYFAAKSNDTVTLTVHGDRTSAGNGAMPLLRPALAWEVEPARGTVAEAATA